LRVSPIPEEAASTHASVVLQGVCVALARTKASDRSCRSRKDCFEQPVKNTIHNLIQTLSVKTSSAARYVLYQDDARQGGMDDGADLFARLAQQEDDAIGELLNCLREQLGKTE
jgi:hypothetical protein